MKKVREDANCPIDEMADTLGIDPKSYMRLESGNRKRVDLQELDIICDKLGINLLELIEVGYLKAGRSTDILKQELLSVIRQYAEARIILEGLQREYLLKLTLKSSIEG